ncbi:MAG: YicC family protein, partial [bacterium]|nr:YicC family protein [bacterium]
MKSMTGYGRGTCEVAGRRLVVEVRSVNHRFLELKLRMPWADAALEAHV